MNDIEVSSIDLVEGGNVFKQGHYLTLGYVPRDEKGEAVDLSGKTLNVALWGRKGVVFEAAATYSGGVIRFTFDKLVAAGDYTVEFTATSSTDAKYRKKFPTNQHSGRIAIKQSADDLGVVGIQVYTVAQLKAEQKAIQAQYETTLNAKVQATDAKSTTALTKSVNAEAAAQDVKNQFEQVVINGDSSVEAAAARVAPDQTFVSLKARLDAKEQATALQLAENTMAESVNNPITTPNLPKKPIITFLDDDGKKVAYSRLRPMINDRGFVASNAIITSRVGKTLFNEEYMTISDIKELMLDGWEMLGHTHDAHTDSMLDYSLDYLSKDVENCRKQLASLGSTSRGFVYPQSNDTESIQQVVQKHFDFSFGRVGINQSENINPMNITRIGFGQPWGTSDWLTLKGHVDNVKANGGWLVFMLHVDNQTESDWVLLEQLLDYVKTSGVSVVTPTEGYSMYGPKFFTGNRFGKYLSIAGESIYGNFDLKLTGNLPFKDLGLNAKTNLSGIDGFEMNVISVTKINSQYAGTTGDFPEKSGGILYTYKNDNSYPMFNRQEYHLYNSTTRYIRFPTNQTAWSPWERFSADGKQSQSAIKTELNTITNEALPSSFSANITMHRLSSAYAVTTNFPTKVSSVLTTYIAGDSNFAYQELKTGDNVTFQRTGINNSWTSWTRRNDLLRTASVSARTIPAKSTIDVTRDLSSYDMYHSQRATVTFDTPLPVGLMYREWVKGDTLYIRIANITDSDIALPASPHSFMV